MHADDSLNTDIHKIIWLEIHAILFGFHCTIRGWTLSNSHSHCIRTQCERVESSRNRMRAIAHRVANWTDTGSFPFTLKRRSSGSLARLLFADRSGNNAALHAQTQNVARDTRQSLHRSRKRFEGRLWMGRRSLERDRERAAVMLQMWMQPKASPVLQCLGQPSWARATPVQSKHTHVIDFRIEPQWFRKARGLVPNRDWLIRGAVSGTARYVIECSDW